MLTVRRLTKELLTCLRPIDGTSLTGEDVMLRIGRSGFVLGYVPLPRAEWRSFPINELVRPETLLADANSAMFLAFEDGCFVGQGGSNCKPEHRMDGDS